MSKEAAMEAVYSSSSGESLSSLSSDDEIVLDEYYTSDEDGDKELILILSATKVRGYVRSWQFFLFRSI